MEFAPDGFRLDLDGLRLDPGALFALIVGGLVIFGILLKALGPSKFFVYLIAWPAAKAARWAWKWLVVKPLWGAWKALLELAAWLGFKGKRFLIFLFLVLLVLMTFRMFGGSTAAWLAAVFVVFAFTSDKRRLVRNSRSIKETNKKVDELVVLAKKKGGATVADSEWRNEKAETAANWWSLHRGGVDRQGFPANTPDEVKTWFTVDEPKPKKERG